MRQSTSLRSGPDHASAAGRPHLDLAAENPDFDPSAEVGFAAKEPNEDERRKLKGEPPYDAEPEDDKGYTATSLEF